MVPPLCSFVSGFDVLFFLWRLGKRMWIVVFWSLGMGFFFLGEGVWNWNTSLGKIV